MTMVCTPRLLSCCLAAASSMAVVATRTTTSTHRRSVIRTAFSSAIVPPSPASSSSSSSPPPPSIGGTRSFTTSPSHRRTGGRDPALHRGIARRSGWWEGATSASTSTSSSFAICRSPSSPAAMIAPRHRGRRPFGSEKDRRRRLRPGGTIASATPRTGTGGDGGGGDGIDDAGSHRRPPAITAAAAVAPTDDEIEKRALSWIRNVVIGYGLCPFADRPLREGRLRLVVVRGDDDEEVASAVVYELVSRSGDSNPGTTVVIAPEYHPDDFEKYMSLVSYIEEDVMDDLDLVGKVQLAPFHPKFVFDGSGIDGIDNFTNRGPYPMFHVLREDEVSIAVDKLDGDAGKVWRRNVDLLGRMEGRYGREGAARMMEGGEDRGEGGGGALPEGMDELLREIRGEHSTSAGRDDE